MPILIIWFILNISKLFVAVDLVPFFLFVFLKHYMMITQNKNNAIRSEALN